MQVLLREGETFDEMFRRFKRGVETSGLLREYKRKQRFKPNHEIRREKVQAALRRRRRSARQDR